MVKNWSALWWVGLFSVVCACDELAEQAEFPRFFTDASTLDGSDDAGMARPGPVFAVINSDWTATAISLLDAKGDVIADNYLHSGSTQAGLVTTLSGDVTLPTRSGDPGVLVVIDRYKTDVITRIRLADGKVLGQVKTHTPPTQTTEHAYSSNPHDYVRIDEHTAWVSRFEPNLDPKVAELDRGNDLLRIDPSTMTRTGERIDLSVFDAVGSRTDPDTGKTQRVRIYARPSALVRLGDMLVVGLARIAFDFSAVGTGMVALVDLKTRRVEGVTLEGLTGCGEVTYVPDDPDRVVVSCRGFYADPDPRMGAGIVLLEVRDGLARVKAMWRAKDHPDAPLFGRAVALGKTEVAVVANDFTGTLPDVLGVLDLTTGAYSVLAEHRPGRGSFGSLHFDAASGLLLVPDASLDKNGKPKGGLRRFVREADGTFVERSMVRVAEETAMPARHVFGL